MEFVIFCSLAFGIFFFGQDGNRRRNIGLSLLLLALSWLGTWDGYRMGIGEREGCRHCHGRQGAAGLNMTRMYMMTLYLEHRT